jgi:hypothetical protein
MCDPCKETDFEGNTWVITADFACVVEHEHWLRHYGICTSKAEWWVHATDRTLYWYPQSVGALLVQLGHGTKFHTGSSRAFLVPKSYFNEYLHPVTIPAEIIGRFGAPTRGACGLEMERLVKAMIDIRLCPIRGADSLKAPPAVDKLQGIDLIVVTDEGAEIPVAVRRDSRADGENLYLETHRRTLGMNWHDAEISATAQAVTTQ